MNYLINEKGIPKERITAKGYGETKTLDDCAKYPDCPQDQAIVPATSKTAEQSLRL